MKSSKEIDFLVEQATEIAEKYDHEYITTEHILLILLRNQDFSNILEDYGVDVDSMLMEVNDYVENKIAPASKDSDPVSLRKTQALDRVFNRAFTQVLFSGRDKITVYDVFVSLMAETATHSSYFILKYGINREDFINFIKTQYAKKIRNQQQEQYWETVLEEYCTDLNKLAQEGEIDPVVGRDTELDDICQIFARRTKNNVLLVGDPGVGKTAIAEGLARKIIDGDVPSYLQDYTVFNLEVGILLAGTQYRGQFEERVKEVLEALAERGRAILFIDEAHTIKGAGGGSTGGTDFANMLKPALGRGKLKVIANTTWEEYTESFEKDRALMRRFHRITIDEPSASTAKEILKNSARYYEEFHNASIRPDAIDAAVDLSVRYQTDRRLPDKAFDLIDSACAGQRRMEVENPVITRELVLYELSKSTSIPLDQLDERKNSNVVDIEAAIKGAVYGQDDTVDTVLESVWVAKAGLGPRDKPLGSYVFAGPTGVGKTELAKQLAHHLGYTLLRYDMSEYQEKHTVARFIGAPPGYVGYEDGNLGGGLLIRDIQRHPNSILLFDEIEKAHPDVVNVFLQLLDEGYVTSSNGKRADARNCIVVMTTNLGAEAAERPTIGFGNPERTGEEETAYREFFRPEFRNRVTAMCKFNKLDAISKRKVVAKFIRELETQLSERGISLHADEPSIDRLIQIGYDDKMGARPLERTINKFLRIPISRELLVDKTVQYAKIVVRMDQDDLILEFRGRNGNKNKDSNGSREVRVRT